MGHQEGDLFLRDGQQPWLVQRLAREVGMLEGQRLSLLEGRVVPVLLDLLERLGMRLEKGSALFRSGGDPVMLQGARPEHRVPSQGPLPLVRARLVPALPDELAALAESFEEESLLVGRRLLPTRLERTSGCSRLDGGGLLR